MTVLFLSQFRFFCRIYSISHFFWAIQEQFLHFFRSDSKRILHFFGSKIHAHNLHLHHAIAGLG